MSNYYQILIHNLPAELEDTFTTFIFEQGAAGMAERLDFTQHPDNYAPKFVDKDVKSVEVYFAAAPAANILETISLEYPMLDLNLSTQEEKDWLVEWKKGFTSFYICEGICLVPSWLSPPPEAKDSIFIDPGLAFGTGTHPTTKLCASLIYEFLNQYKVASILDVGAGTGILSILAAKLSQAKIEATEIDDMARDCAKENIKINQIPSIVVHDKQVEDLNKTYDLIIANIIDGVLTDLKADFLRLSKLGSYFILSGILKERQKIFEDRFGIKNFEVLKMVEQDEWLAYMVKRK